MVSGIQSGGTGTGAMTAPKRRHGFDRMDKNGDGSLDESELAGVAKRTGKSAADFLKQLDASGDGTVDAQELEAGRPKRGHGHGGKGGDGEAVSEFTTSLMNLLEQLKSSGHGEAQGPDGCEGNSDATADADQTTQADQTVDDPKLQSAATEFTSALMNIMKQLRVSETAAA